MGETTEHLTNCLIVDDLPGMLLSTITLQKKGELNLTESILLRKMTCKYYNVETLIESDCQRGSYQIITCRLNYAFNVLLKKECALYRLH